MQSIAIFIGTALVCAYLLREHYKLTRRTTKDMLTDAYLAALHKGYTKREARAHIRAIIHDRYHVDKETARQLIHDAIYDAHLTLHIHSATTAAQA